MIEIFYRIAQNSGGVKTLMNWHRKHVGEENFGEFAPLLHPANPHDIQSHNDKLSQQNGRSREAISCCSQA